MLQNWQNITIGVLTTALLLALGVILVQRQWLGRARHDAAHDDLTGLPNRRTATRHLRAALRGGRPTGIVLLDLDRFKTVNDTHGHDGGNEVLKEVARRLAALTDVPVPIAVAARLSGDEFLLIVHGDRDDTSAAAHAALTAIGHRPVLLTNHHIAVTASAGWATAALGTTTRELLHTADTAMYQIKRDGRANVRGAATIADQEGIGRLPRPRDLRDLRDEPTAEHPIRVRSIRRVEESPAAADSTDVYFDLPAVLRLAEHATVGIDHTAAYGESADGVSCPAALVVIKGDDGYRMSSGRPGPDRVLHAQGRTPEGTPHPHDAHLDDDFAAHLNLAEPLEDQGTTLLDALRDGHARGHRYLFLKIGHDTFDIAITHDRPPGT